MNKTLAQLNEQFSIPGSVIIKENEYTDDRNLFYIQIENEFATANIQLQGAHLTSWQPKKSAPVIWLSEDVKYMPKKSIRGGIPICWPWFGAHESNSTFPAHGFARTVNWNIESTENSQSGVTQIRLSLDEDNIPKEQWPANTRVECIFTIGATLELELVTHNNSSENIVIGEALHTYFNVSDVRNIIITGLDGCEYLDKLDDFKCKTQSGNIDIKEEVDRVYTATDHSCVIEDIGLNRKINIIKESSFSTIVWNPWEHTANKMGDLGKAGYLNMVCVESGNATQDVVTIPSNKKHTLFVRYEIDALN